MNSANVSDSSILRLNDYKTMQFLDLYEKERCLWDITSEYFKNKLKRRHATERIAEALNVKNFSSKHVQMKFSKLRSAYSAQLKKIAKSKAAGEDPVYCPKVFWFSRMEFMRPYMQLFGEEKSGEKKSYFEEEKEEIHVVKVKHAGIFLYEDEVAPYGPPETRSTSLSTASRASLEDDYDSSIFQPLGDDLSQPSIYSQQQEERPRSSEYSNSLVKRVSTYSNTSRPTQPRVEDCFDSFGNYVATMFKNMPFQRAMAVQPQIVKLLISGITDNSEGPSNRSDQNGNLQ